MNTKEKIIGGNLKIKKLTRDTKKQYMEVFFCQITLKGYATSA
jgi:hypothetical protein